MEKITFSKIARFFLIAFFLLLLIGVRAFEHQLFYDPFLLFFKSNYQNQALPEFNGLKLFVGLFFRYGWNAFFSLVIIYLLFKDKKMLIFSVWLYVFFFIFLCSIFFGMLIFKEHPNYLVLFYVRRFLIQPLFLVLFVPAFYYQRKTK